MTENKMYDSESEAESEAEREIGEARARINEISKSIKRLSKEGNKYKLLLNELNGFLKYSKHYEYFCVSDEANDSSAYLDVYSSDEKDYEWWTLAGVPYRIKGNPIPRLARQTLEKIIGGKKDGGR